MCLFTIECTFHVDSYHLLGWGYAGGQGRWWHRLHIDKRLVRWVIGLGRLRRARTRIQKRQLVKSIKHRWPRGALKLVKKFETFNLLQNRSYNHIILNLIRDVQLLLCYDSDLLSLIAWLTVLYKYINVSI